MITKEELLAAFEDSTRTLELNNQIFGLALKGLESESTVKRLIQARDQWRKKHDDLADELDDKIIALKDKLKAKDDDWSLSVSYYMDLAAVWEKQAKALKAKLKKCEAVLAGKD